MMHGRETSDPATLVAPKLDRLARSVPWCSRPVCGGLPAATKPRDGTEALNDGAIDALRGIAAFVVVLHHGLLSLPYGLEAGLALNGLAPVLLLIHRLGCTGL